MQAAIFSPKKWESCRQSLESINILQTITGVVLHYIGFYDLKFNITTPSLIIIWVAITV